MIQKVERVRYVVRKYVRMCVCAFCKPTGSMHGRFTYIYQKHEVNVDKYIIHGSHGKIKFGLTK